MRYVKALFYATAMAGFAAIFREQAISMWNEPDFIPLALAVFSFGFGTYCAYETITALTK